MIIGISAILTTMIAIVVLTRMGVKLVFVMLAGALLLALFSRMYPLEAAKTTWNAVSDPETIRLLLIIIFITALGHLMKVTGSFIEIIINLRAVVTDLRLLIMLIPALVGLLAFPGGAIMSAPLIEEIGDEIKLDKDSLATANIIFRHIYSFLFPFSTGILIISSITEINVLEFVKFNLPVILIGMPFIFFCIFRKIKIKKVKRKPVKLFMVVSLFLSLLPFVLVLFMALVLEVYFPIALLTGLLYVIFLYKIKPEIAHPRSLDFLFFSDYVNIVKRRISVTGRGIKWNMVLAVLGIMIFKDFVTASEFLVDISVFLLQAGIPLFALALLFPLLAGLMTGHNGAALGMSVPLFLPLVPAGTGGIPYYNLIYICSVVGYVSSPFHLCLILTTEYYKASLTNVLKYVGFAGLWIIAISFVRFLMLTI